MSFLTIDYDKAIAQAKKLEEAASKCKDTMNDLKREKNNLMQICVGEAGDAMRMKLEEAEYELNLIQGNLKSIAAAIRRAAENLKRDDDKIRDIIKRFS